MATDVEERLAALLAAGEVEEVRRVYDEWAPTYDGEEVAALLGHAGPERVAARVAELVDPRTDVLDAGCGTGLVGVALAARGTRQRATARFVVEPGRVAAVRFRLPAAARRALRRRGRLKATVTAVARTDAGFETTRRLRVTVHRKRELAR